MNKIKVRENGPLLCEGQIELYDTDGELVETTDNVALCRCGASTTPPYCNKNHFSEFKHDGQFEDEKAEEPSDSNEPLKIMLKTNGMYVAKGPMEIYSHDGQSKTYRTKATICRCGLSANKPFCDASHKTLCWEQPY